MLFMIMPMNGSEILSEALERHGVDTFFIIMGASMMLAENACNAKGMRGVDVRHAEVDAFLERVRAA